MESDELQILEDIESDLKDKRAAMKKAADYLARREHSCHEIWQKLTRSGFADDIAETAVAALLRQGLVSDHRFAKAYIRYRKSKGFGPVRIQMELVEKGVNSSLIDLAMKHDEAGWVERATSVRIKKYGPKKPDEFKERARQARFLQYRGFTSEQIQHALNSDN